MTSAEVEANAGIVHMCVRAYSWAINESLDWEDLTQEAHVAMLRAHEVFDPELGAWSTIACTYMRRRLDTFVKERSNAVRVPAKAQTSAYRAGLPSPVMRRAAVMPELPASETPESSALDAERAELAADLLRSLPRRERSIVYRSIFGGESMAEIARDLGVSRQWVSWVRGQSIKKMRATAEAQA